MKMISINTDVAINEKHQNAAIVGHVLSPIVMQENGFRYVSALNEWYHCSTIESDITLNIAIPKNDPANIRIDVIDECFGQPYDYQALIMRCKPVPVPAYNCYNYVNEQLKSLQTVGIISGFVEGDYV